MKTMNLRSKSDLFFFFLKVRRSMRTLRITGIIDPFVVLLNPECIDCQKSLQIRATWYFYSLSVERIAHSYTHTRTHAQKKKNNGRISRLLVSFSILNRWMRNYERYRVERGKKKKKKRWNRINKIPWYNVGTIDRSTGGLIRTAEWK